MRYSAELAARAQAWLALPLAERRSATGLLELTQVWAAAQGLPSAPLCRQCQYSDRVHDLNAYLREYARFTSTTSVMAEDTTAAPATYQLKPEYAGQTLTSDDYGKAVTAENLTDEDAEHFIKKGFGHVFQKIGAAIVGAGEKLEGEGNDLASDEADDQPTEREQELQAQYEQAEAAYTAEVASHAQTVEQVTQARAAYDQVSDALASEQQAHTATKAQAAELQEQLTDAQGQVSDLQAALAAATAPKAKKGAAAPAGDSTQGDSTSTAS